MKGFLKITGSKIKGFRLNKVCGLMVVLATVRTLMAGESIWLTGVCAAILPFMCQMRDWPRAEGASALADSLSTYLANFFYMAVYLAVVGLLTVAGQAWVPTYEADPYFMQKLMMVVCGDVVFISALCLIGRSLSFPQLLLAGVIMSNGELGFSFMASMAANAGLLDGCFLPCSGFCAVVVIMTLVMAVSGDKMVARAALRKDGSDRKVRGGKAELNKSAA